MIKITKSNIHYYKHDIIKLINYTLDDIEKSKRKVDELIISYISSSNTYVFGHVRNNELISFVWFFKRSFNNIDRMHVSFIATDSRYRGLGLGSKLLEIVYKTSLEKSIEYIDLNVSPDNLNALSLYKKLNFKTEKLLLIKSLKEEE